MTASAPPSSGVTEGQRRSDWAKESGECSIGSVPQQLVDPRLRARLRINALHDDGAVEGRARGAVRERLAGERAGDDDRIRGHAADEDLAGVAVDDLGRGRNEDAHGEHRTL